MASPPITAEQIDHYWTHGYCLVPGLFSEAELEALRVRFLGIVEGRIEPARDMLVMKDVMVAKGVVSPSTRAEAIAKVQDFHHDEVLYGYATHSPLLDVVERFCGPDIKVIHNMLINKPPNVDGRHPLHQDLLYFLFRPADRIVATWTALEPTNRENGCLVVVPGSHRGGELLEHERPDWEHVNFAYLGATTVGADSCRTHLEMTPGETVLFHPLLLHGSGRNRSSNFRRAISAHFASAACTFIKGGREMASIRHYDLVRGRAHAGGI